VIACSIGITIGILEYIMCVLAEKSSVTGVGTISGSVLLLLVGIYIKRDEMKKYIPVDIIQLRANVRS